MKIRDISEFSDKEINALPAALKAQLKSTNKVTLTDKVEAIIYESAVPVSFEYVLVKCYKDYGKACSRSQLINVVYNLRRKKRLLFVKKGVYSRVEEQEL